MDISSGSQLQFIEALAGEYLFTGYPTTSTDEVQVIGRVRPTNIFTLNDTVPFDDWAIVHYATWAYLVADESNPAGAAKEQGLFDMRIKMLKDNSEKGIVLLNPNSNDIPTRWS
jgi:hypothetical protein